MGNPRLPVRSLLRAAAQDIREAERRAIVEAYRRRVEDREPDVEINGDDEDEAEVNAKALHPDELDRLLAELGDWRPFVEFLYETALQIGEAIEVRYGDLDIGERWLHVHRRYYRGKVKKPKGRKTRDVRLTRTRTQYCGRGWHPHSGLCVGGSVTTVL